MFSRTFQILLLSSILFSSVLPDGNTWPGYKTLYKEQYYRLYHEHLYMYSENYAENIHWLEQAQKADFANPLNAIARIQDKREWEWYRNLFTMHVNLLIVQNYVQWAKGFIKEQAFFYNEPWKEQNLKSLEKAQELLETAQIYWLEVENNVEEIKALNIHFMNLEEIQYWEDEYYRISTAQLDYKKIIHREIVRIERVREDFLEMDETTY